MPNIYAQFKELIPDDPQYVVKIVEVGDTHCVVRLLGGTDVSGDGFNGILETVLGTGTVGSYVYVKGGVIVGAAPSLPVVEVIVYGL